MTQAEAFAELRAYLSGCGGYLRNTLHAAGVTCDVCAGPIQSQYARCYRCAMSRSTLGVADLVGSMIYAFDGAQSGRLMYGYKSAYPGPSHKRTVSALVVLGVREHKECANRLVGVDATNWATIPSLRKIGSAHPFRAILTAEISPGSEIEVVANPPISDPRDIDPTNYLVVTPVPPGAHVMVIDDTWTSGGHAQSVSAALKAAGAGKVSILTVARWVDPSAPWVRQWVDDHMVLRPYNPAGCPWTGGACPPS